MSEPYISRAALLLFGTQIFGLNSMFGQAYRSGWFAAILHIANSDSAVLPGSQTPVLKQYTGIHSLDAMLVIAAVMWDNVTSGSTPQLSLYAVQFGGQLVPIFAVMMIEGLREGNTRNSFYFSILWGYMMQMVGYATTMPIYCCLHLFTSPAARNDQHAIRPRKLSHLDLKAIIPAFGLGYGVLSLLFAYPFTSGNLRQWLCAVWQGFPHYVVGFQYLFAALYERFSSSSSRQLGSRTFVQDRQALSKVYNFAFNVAAATQILTFTILGAVKVCPQIFPRSAVETLSFTKVFIPGPFYSKQPMESIGTAAHSFYLYDQYSGSAAALIWAITLHIGSKKASLSWRSYASLGWDICRWSLIAGPGGALVRLLQYRDETVLSDDGVDEHKAS